MGRVYPSFTVVDTTGVWRGQEEPRLLVTDYVEREPWTVLQAVRHARDLAEALGQHEVAVSVANERLWSVPGRAPGHAG